MARGAGSQTVRRPSDSRAGREGAYRQFRKGRRREQGHAVPHSSPDIQPGLADLERISVVVCSQCCRGTDLEDEDGEHGAEPVNATVGA